jgi:uncharacterized protein
MKRIDISFRSGADQCEAWLYLPKGQGPFPCIVVAHGIGAIRQVRLSAYAERFTAAGYSMLSFDYRHWGASGGSPRYICSVARQLNDIDAAINAAASRPEVDAGQIALFGTSFGGGHALVMGARRPDLAAVMSQCTVSDCLAVALRAPLKQVIQWVGAGLVDQLRSLVGLAPKYIKLAGAPGEAALMTKLGAEQAYEAMQDGPSPWKNLIAARLMLTLPLYRPIRSARRIKPPLLMVICENDEICPAALAHRAAVLAPKGRAASFNSSHFEIYFGGLFNAATREMIAFLDSVINLKATPSGHSEAVAPASLQSAVGATR